MRRTDSGQLTPATLTELWEAAVAIEIPLQGQPKCSLLFDPVSASLRLRTDYSLPEPDVTSLTNIKFSAFVDGERDVAEIAVHVGTGSLQHGYGLLATIADRLQHFQQPLAMAVATGIEEYRDLLAERTSLSLQKQIGLFGELSFLEFLLDRIGPSAGIASWHGPLSEEHDFALGAIHLEVKTTAGERRAHVVHGLDQLVPSGNVPLVVLSTRITRSAPANGRTLPAIVASVRSKSSSRRSAVNSKLAAAGWDDADGPLYDTAWVLRDAPRAYRVDDSFPALTSKRLETVVPQFGRLSDFTYTVDLTDLETHPLPSPLDQYTDGTA